MEVWEMIDKMDFYINEIKKEWSIAREDFPSFLCPVSEVEKASNEAYITKTLDEFHKIMKSFRRFRILKKYKKRKAMTFFYDKLHNENILSLHKILSFNKLDHIFQEILDFLSQSQTFAPELSLEDTGQAIRNYMVYLMFKEIHGVESDFSMAAFSYSMLYPITDNYIDKEDTSSQRKIEYNQMIRQKIQGEQLQTKTLHQSRTSHLLQTIEDFYPRKSNPALYQLLLFMLQAQEDSMRQQDNTVPLSYEDCLDISAYKGGLSVLIDRFLVPSPIKVKDFFFYLSFGLFLQFADDLQDIGEDAHHGYTTLFTYDSSTIQVERMTNKLFHFLHEIWIKYAPEEGDFMDFLLSSSFRLILISIFQSRDFFSISYLKKMEAYLPVTIPFLIHLQEFEIEFKDKRYKIGIKDF